MHFPAGLLQQWLQSAFLPALKVVQSHGQVVDTPLVSLVRNALSHLVGVGSKRDLACGLFHGLGANLDEAGQHKLAAEIGRLTGQPNVLSSTGATDPSAVLRSQPHLLQSLVHTWHAHIRSNVTVQAILGKPCVAEVCVCQRVCCVSTVSACSAMHFKLGACVKLKRMLTPALQPWYSSLQCLL